jgi:hypothetical protein
MAGADYYRKQAQLFARLALTSRTPEITERYSQLALDYLAKAEKLEPSTTEPRLSAPADIESDVERE